MTFSALDVSTTLALIGTVFVVFIPGASGLQCFNCRGITHFDQNQCFEPVYRKTISQECANGELCEKKIYRLDHRQEVIERGCSSNCNGRTYIWTSDFRIHCCGDENLCNTGRVARLSLVVVALSAFACVLVT